MMFEEFQRDLYRNFIEKDRWLMLLRGLCAAVPVARTTFYARYRNVDDVLAEVAAQ